MRVLCVSPRFAPVNAADSHRLRLLLPYFARLGWEAEVLAVEPADIPAPADPWLAARLPANVPVHRVRARPRNEWALNGLGQRSFRAFYLKGSALMREKHFDLVFFSTTDFLLHALGPLWRRRFGVPFCMDYQDPWINDYYRLNRRVKPPGGHLKFALADRLHRVVERAVVRRCNGFLAVSSAYLEMLDVRYGPAVARQPRLVAAFPAQPDEQTHSLLDEAAMGRSPKVWRYVGRGGDDLALSATAFFDAWRLAIDRGLLGADAVRFEAIGTSYDPSPVVAQTIAPHAQAAGLTAQVMEQTSRVGYSEMLTLLAQSDALVVFGSDDPAYTASKIYPYLLADKPLLAIFRQESSVVGLLKAVGGGTCVSFGAATNPNALAQDIVKLWFSNGDSPPRLTLDADAFEPFTAASQARRLTDWFCAASRLEAQS